jgi:outer membrane lipoprotein SlyB
MTLSVTLPAKKFQLFQPMGGVAAVTGAALGVDLGAGLGAGVGAIWAAAGAVGLETKAAMASTAKQRDAEVRMMEAFLKRTARR